MPAGPFTAATGLRFRSTSSHVQTTQQNFCFPNLIMQEFLIITGLTLVAISAKLPGTGTCGFGASVYTMLTAISTRL